MGRRLLFQLLLASLVLALLPLPAQAPVTGVTVATDRPSYLVGTPVTATATITFNGQFSAINEPALVEWFDAGWVRLRAEYANKTQVGGDARAVAVWTPPGPGTYAVNVSSNRTNGTPPVFTGSATFRVAEVVAVGIAVATDRRQYEPSWTATATANVTAVGNTSLLERVRFDWFNETFVLVRQAVNASLVRGVAVDAYVPTAPGMYTVNATYLGNDTVSNTTTFVVVPATVLASDVPTGGSVTWDAATRWRVCTNLTVAAGGALTIEAGATIRFCRGSRLTVRGSLIADGAGTARITLTSYEEPPAPGDWAGVRFEPGASGRLVDVVVEFVGDGVAVSGSSPLLEGLTFRSGLGEAVNLTDSSASLRDAVVLGFARGVRLWNASASLDNVTVAGPSREGMAVGNTAGAVVQGLTVSGGNYSVAAVSSTDLAFERADLTGAAIRGVDLKASTALFANTTIAAAGSDFLLVASTATLRNCTFTDAASRRTLVSPSRIRVENFLAVTVSANGTGLPGARVTVFVNGVPLPARTTDAGGRADWIPVEDRVIAMNGSAEVTTKDVVVVNVTRAGFEVTGGSRTVDMGSSHTEAFTATWVGVNGPNDGNGPLPTLDILVIGVAILAALLVAFFLLLWRRRRREEKPAEPEPAPEELPPAPPKPLRIPFESGRAYAVLAEKPDTAFERFASDTSAGVPGLCVTRLRPEDARARFGLEGVPVHWLSRSFGKESLNPTNLGAIVELVRRQATKPGFRVLLDGLEYLYTQNDFGKVVKFVQALVDVVAETRAVLLLPVNPKSFDPDRLAILTRDLQTVR